MIRRAICWVDRLPDDDWRRPVLGFVLVTTVMMALFGWVALVVGLTWGSP